MNVKFLNPFVESAYEVLKAEMGQEITRGELKLDSTAYISDDITVVIALVGSVEGTVFYSMNKATGLQIACQMMGEQLSVLDPLAQSGIAELGNVITGRASMKLSSAGFEATISPPSLIIGNGAVISTLELARLVVPLETIFGAINIHLALREGRNNRLKTAQIPVPEAPLSK
jgi:chemotaxis protein CheX